MEQFLWAQKTCGPAQETLVIIASASNESSDKFAVHRLVRALAACIHIVWM